MNIFYKEAAKKRINAKIYMFNQNKFKKYKKFHQMSHLKRIKNNKVRIRTSIKNKKKSKKPKRKNINLINTNFKDIKKLMSRIRNSKNSQIKYNHMILIIHHLKMTKKKRYVNIFNKGIAKKTKNVIIFMSLLNYNQNQRKFCIRKFKMHKMKVIL